MSDLDAMPVLAEGTVALGDGRLLAVSGQGLEAARAAGAWGGTARAREVASDVVRSWVADAGLQGRGGAWFPLARKWEAAVEADGIPVVVVNGAEDEPGSRKDRHLMATRPHLVLDGAVVAATAVGADTIVLYVNEAAHGSLDAIRGAMDEAAAAGLLDGCEVRLVEAPAVYVAGEDSAAVEFIDSGTAQPRSKPPYPATAGVDGRPTVVSNVETVAHVALIARFGPDWFREQGPDHAPGTMLVTMPECFLRPGIYEIPVGTNLRDLMAAAGGVPGGEPRGIQVGGPAAGWLVDFDVALDPASVAAAGSMLGCGALNVLEAGACAVDASAAVAAFFAAESCGKCPPCRMTTQFHDRALSGLVAGNTVNAGQLDTALELTTMAREGTDCSLAGFPGAPLRTARAAFADDFTRHLDGEDCQLQHNHRPLQVGH